ncbi:TldD/PmbA family protein [Stygiolobus caldivivus]|uniref:Peptidase U62 modulator of DNA gyrase n=1 Tax=Stygiolobus caldivivus TaxID=2824673 RepID=A0A8D5U7X8_9CREN|nr:TldD/PmbA family protein [Stygiolobus caldivivus]BCU71425.1 hypothetical protein KN1_27220 [Stygiolobus caldivivus]
MVDEYTLIQRAKDLGYEAEIYSVKSKNFQVKRGEQFYSFNLVDQGYGLRVIKDGRVGFAYSTVLDEGILNLAIESSKASKEDKFNVLPSPEKVNRINLKFFELNEVREKVKEYEGVLGEIRGFANVIAEYYEFTVSEVKVISTEGVDVNEQRSLGSVSVVFNFKRDDFITPEFYEGITVRDLSKLDPQKIVDEARKKGEIFKKRTVLDKKVKEAVFTPKAISSLLSPLLSYAVSLENVYRGKSTLKEGEILSEKLNIIDNPNINWAPYSRSFDGEGLPSKETRIVSDGKVTTFLSNTYWANRAGKANTHSSSRFYSSLPVISSSILDIDIAPDAEEDTVVIDQVQGVHTSNFDTGEFSVVGSVAWYNQVAIREVVITGTLKDMLKGIIGGIGKDKEVKGNVYTRSLKVGNINIA